MANIRKIEGKTGTSFKITVTKGRDSNDKQIRHYKTWTPDKPMTARQMEKEAQRVAFEFEREIELGYQADSRQTFDEYARYVIGLREQVGGSERTAELYKWMLERISGAFGYMKLNEIRPQHLNAFYRKLAEDGERKVYAVATPRVDFKPCVIEAGGTREFRAQLKIGCKTVTALYGGASIAEPSALKVAAAMGRKPEELFTFEREKKPLSNGTIVRFHNFISSVFSQAEKEMLIQYNPATRATPPQRGEHDINYFQPEQLREILAAADTEPIRLRMIIYLLAVTGMRRGELLALEWNKIDFENRIITVDQSVTYTVAGGVKIGPTKTKNTRYITIPKETVLMLKQYRAWWSEQKIAHGDLWGDTALLFVQETGGPVLPGRVNEWLARFSKRHGLPYIHPHTFRHTAASIMIANNVDIVTVSNMLGHANTSMTTDTYSHIIAEARQRASECIADVILRNERA